MANLSDADRARIWRGLMRYWSSSRAVVALRKADLRAAVDATDAWIDSNQVSFNNALPVAARSSLTAEQKTLLFCVVAILRVTPGVPDLLRRLLGMEVD